MGVGGEFAVGVALVAEVMPERARPYCLGVLQALSAVGNISAALINMTMGHLVEHGIVDSVWRPMFVIGAMPALLGAGDSLAAARAGALAAGRRMTGEVARKLGSYRELFGHPIWRRHALVGLGLAFSGIVGLWGVGFFTFDLVGNIFRAAFSSPRACRRTRSPAPLPIGRASRRS